MFVEYAGIYVYNTRQYNMDMEAEKGYINLMACENILLEKAGEKYYVLAYPIREGAGVAYILGCYNELDKALSECESFMEELND